MPTTDDDLVARLRGATRSERDVVFGEIFRTHRGRVFGVCRYLCGPGALAEDALQETFLETYKGLAGFRGDSQLGTWIYRIAVRTALRLRSRQGTLAETPIEDAGTTVHPHDRLAARERMRQVQAAIDRLPAEQRAVLALFAVDGFGHAEIAGILGIPEGTVWSRLHKARNALEATLAQGARSTPGT